MDAQEVDDEVGQNWTAACALVQCALRGGREVRKAKSYFRFSDKERTSPHRKYGEMGGATERVGVLERHCLTLREEVEHLSGKTRSFGCSDGGQDEHAEGRTRRASEADLPGVEIAGAA